MQEGGDGQVDFQEFNYVEVTDFRNDGVVQPEPDSEQVVYCYTDEAMEAFNNEIVKNLYNEFTRRNLTLYELAKTTETDLSYLYRIFKFQRPISLTILFRLCYALGLNLDDVVKLNRNDEYKEKALDALSGLSEEKVDKMVKLINLLKPYGEDQKKKISIKFEFAPVKYIKKEN